MRNNLFRGLVFFLFAGFLVAGLTGCLEEERGRPAFPGLTFDIVSDGETLHLLYGKKSEDAAEPLRFFYVRSADAGTNWTIPVEIPTAHAEPGRHHRSNDPQMAVSGNRMLVVWTAHGYGPWGSGPLASALSQDGGATWSAGPAPAVSDDAAAIGFRFPAVAATGEAFHAVWIHAEDRERSLRHAVLPFGSSQWSEPSVVDPRICACCWNRLRTGDDGSLYVLYRDQEPSDMGFAVSVDSGQSWEIRQAAGAFDWRFDGCPHIGGGLAVGRNEAGEVTLWASVWTGNEADKGAYAWRTTDGGYSWDLARRLERDGDGRSNDIAYLGDGRLVAVWDEPVGAEAQGIFASTSSDGGLSWSEAFLLSGEAGYALHPRVVAVRGEAAVFWTEQTADRSLILGFGRVEVPPSPTAKVGE